MPFTAGLAFRKGDVPSTYQVVLSGSSANAQAVVKATWPDGSAKHVIASGLCTVSGGTATFAVSAGTQAAGAPLALADLKSALNQPVAIDVTDAKDWTFDTAPHVVGASFAMVDSHGSPYAGTVQSWSITVNNGAALSGQGVAVNGTTGVVTGTLSGGTVGGRQTVTVNLTYLDDNQTPRPMSKTIEAYVRTGGGIEWNGSAMGYAASNVGQHASVSWSGSDWDSPFLSWVSGPLMSSWIYRKVFGNDATLTAWIEVRLYAGGAVEVLPWIEQGYMRVAGNSKRATYSFKLGGTERCRTTIELGYRARTPLIEGGALSYWLGADPALVPVHDASYLQSTELVPTYSGVTAPTANVIKGLPTTYVPLQQGNYTDGMGSTGYQEAIGLLPQWDASHLTCTDKTTTFKGVIRNHFSAGRWDIHFRDEATNRPMLLSAHPNFSNNSSGTYDYAAPATGTLARGWDVPHHPSVGYFAYLLTGWHYHLETLQFAATYNYLAQPSHSDARNGAAGLFLSYSGAATTRGAAWAIRTLAQAASITPDADPLKAEFIASLEANIAFNHARYVAQPNNPQGFVAPYYGADNDPNDGKFNERSWMQDFYTAAFGYLLAMSPSVSSAAKTKLVEFFAWKAQNVVGRLGGTGPTEYLYCDAAVYDIWCAPAERPSVDFLTGKGPWYPNWGALYRDQFGVANPGVGGDLRGGHFPEATSYWGNLVPAIAYAVRHGVAGATAAYARMTGASNWAQLANNFNDAPVWGVRPAVGA